MVVADTDYGVGIIKKVKNTPHFFPTDLQEVELTYENLSKHRRYLLNLIPADKVEYYASRLSL